MSLVDEQRIAELNAQLDADLERDGHVIGEIAPERRYAPAKPLALADRTPVEWAIEDLWTKGDLGLVVGDGGAFKSSAALHIVAAVAGGYPVFGKYATLAGPALIVSAEDPENVVAMRVDAFCQGQGWDRERVVSNMHLLAGMDASLADAGWQAHMALEVKRLQPAFIVLDPLAELLHGDENSNTDARLVVKFARSLSAICGSCVAIVHHAGKQTQGGRALDRIRGASAIASAARVILFFEWREDGIHVENLKMSRAERLKPFLLERRIESQPERRANWISARLGVKDARAASLDRAQRLVLGRMADAEPRLLNSRQLRATISAGSGLRKEDFGAAISALDAAGFIEYEGGEPGKEKRWKLTPSGRMLAQPYREDISGTGSPSAPELDPVPRGLTPLFDPSHPVPDPVPDGWRGGNGPDDPVPLRGTQGHPAQIPAQPSDPPGPAEPDEFADFQLDPEDP